MKLRETRRQAPPRIDLHGAFIRYTDWSNSSIRDGNLSGADLTGASFRNSDLQGTRLTGAILRGADFTDARNLTVEQLANAVIDEQTLLPDYIDRSRLLYASQTTTEAAS